MTEEIRGVALTEVPTNSQRLFVRYLMATLIDLTVLNLFDEHWRHVTVDSFTISILAAVLLQVLLKTTLALEHKVAGYFSANARRRRTGRPVLPAARVKKSVVTRKPSY
jgi:hypothetical protein